MQLLPYRFLLLCLLSVDIFRLSLVLLHNRHIIRADLSKVVKARRQNAQTLSCRIKRALLVKVHEDNTDS